MSTVRAVASGVLLTLALTSSASADQLTVGSAYNSWTFYLSSDDGGPLATKLRGFRDASIRSSTPSNANNPPPQPTPTSSPTLNAPVLATPFFTPDSIGVSPPPAAVSSTNTASTVSSTPVSAPIFTQPAASSTPTSTVADAYLNFDATKLPEAAQLTVGNAAPWYASPAVIKAFGGSQPSADQQAQFISDVKNDVLKTYSLAGMSPIITTDPNVAANHTISIASGLSYAANPNAIGITDVGHNGFGFIDKLNFASDEQSLAWAVAHNISHELMHAFGLSYHPDQTGQYIDAPSATWDLLTNPNTTFSQAAASALTSPSSSDLGVYGAPPTASAQTLNLDGDLEIINTPEPATVAAWTLVLAGAAAYRRRRSTRLAA